MSDKTVFSSNCIVSYVTYISFQLKTSFYSLNIQEVSFLLLYTLNIVFEIHWNKSQMTVSINIFDEELGFSKIEQPQPYRETCQDTPIMDLWGETLKKYRSDIVKTFVRLSSNGAVRADRLLGSVLLIDVGGLTPWQLSSLYLGLSWNYSWEQAYYVILSLDSCHWTRLLFFVWYFEYYIESKSVTGNNVLKRMWGLILKSVIDEGNYCYT